MSEQEKNNKSLKLLSSKMRGRVPTIKHQTQVLEQFKKTKKTKEDAAQKFTYDVIKCCNKIFTII